MSSSDEDVIRRPARGPGAGHQPSSPSGSEGSNGPAVRDQSPVGSDAPNMNGDDDDADLFGSEGSDAGLDHEYD